VQDVFTSLRAFANFLRKQKLIRRNFMKGVEKPKVPALPPVTVPDEVLISMLDVLNPKRPPKGYSGRKWRFVALRNRAIVLVFVDCMLRSAELRNLSADDVHFDEGMIQVVLGKGGKSRRTPFSAETARAVRQYLDERRRRFRLSDDRGTLFVDQSGGPLTKPALRSIFASLKRLTGYPGRLFPHALRHTAAKIALRQGADVFSLAKTLGHSTLAVTRRYAELDDAEIARQHRIWSPATRLLRGR
jgi:site-specific recombinase XerD